MSQCEPRLKLEAFARPEPNEGKPLATCIMPDEEAEASFFKAVRQAIITYGNVWIRVTEEDNNVHTAD